MSIGQLLKIVKVDPSYTLPLQNLQVKLGVEREFCVNKCQTHIVLRGDCECHNNV